MDGIIGIVSENDCREDLFNGATYLLHTGIREAGLATYDGAVLSKELHNIFSNQFRAKFSSLLDLMGDRSGIGAISSLDPQPLIKDTHFGTLAAVFCGFIRNQQDICESLLKNGETFETRVDRDTNEQRANSVEIIIKLLNKGKDIEKGIQHVWDTIEGSASILLLFKEGLIAARDRYGRSSLTLASKKGSYLVINEDCCLANLGYSVERYLEPGEIIFISTSGVERICAGDPERSQLCPFLFLYTSNPNSAPMGIRVAPVRRRCGESLAERDNIHADLVFGVADSGIFHGQGYAERAGIPYIQAAIKYNAGFDRSYFQLTQNKRDEVAYYKQLLIPEFLQGKRVVLLDDSIVRGTQLHRFILRMKRECGTQEVHGRIACPLLLFPCYFLPATRTKKELASRRAIRIIYESDLEDISDLLDINSPLYQKITRRIAVDMDMDTLMYGSIEDTVQAIGMKKEHLCSYCMTGQQFSQS